ncbi:hypothetical protein SeMB42_g03632 [Synchytrium endobioticum]|uniref:protein S-acyltransferase n=1 Tax=Synchytrium endobioticum TaxID=286115 RepID=A0A507D5W6_9FUNG|nr:hypothetical protein SeLEV6574_g03674 [Synchytrium endobioticum]TPX46598.1 hypothetical protein SeMB42_g03632 [Synchytrium endobioticum]
MALETASSISRSSSVSSSNPVVNEHLPHLEEWPENVQDLGKMIFSAINDGDREKLQHILSHHPSSTLILQLLLTTAYSNHDAFYAHDPDVIADANELLGASVSNLNAIQIACLLGDEDIATDILDFVASITEEIEAKKILLEFVGRIWGAGNTVLHLASFLGMADLVRRLLAVGANPNKRNDRNYRPVDCADDDVTMKQFTEIAIEFVRVPPKVCEGRSSITSISDTSAGKRRLSQVTHQMNDDIISRGHTKSQSEAPPTRRASESAPASTMKRSLSADTKQTIESVAVLSSHSESTSPVKTTARSAPSTSSSGAKQSVTFDPATMILDICHHGDPVDNVALPTLRSALGLLPGTRRVDVNQIFTPYNWLTPLHQACTHGHYHIVMLLLTEAASCVNTTDKEGWTPLHCACVEGHVEILQLLGRCQGKLEDDSRNKDWFHPPDGPICLVPVNEDGETPEDVALEAKSKEIRSILSDLKKKYPPPARAAARNTDDTEEPDRIDDSEEDDESDGPPPPKLIIAPAPVKSAIKQSALQRHQQLLRQQQESIDIEKAPRSNAAGDSSASTEPWNFSYTANATSRVCDVASISKPSIVATPAESARPSIVSSTPTSINPSSPVQSNIPRSFSFTKTGPSVDTTMDNSNEKFDSPSTSKLSSSITNKSSSQNGLPPLHPATNPATTQTSKTSTPSLSTPTKIPKVSSTSPPSIRAHPPTTEQSPTASGSIRRGGRRMSNQDLSTSFIRLDTLATSSLSSITGSMGHISSTSSDTNMNGSLSRRRSKDPATHKQPADTNLRRLRGTKDGGYSGGSVGSAASLVVAPSSRCNITSTSSATGTKATEMVGTLGSSLDRNLDLGHRRDSRESVSREDTNCPESVNAATSPERKEMATPIQSMGSVQASSRATFKSVRSPGATR